MFVLRQWSADPDTSKIHKLDPLQARGGQCCDFASDAETIEDFPASGIEAIPTNLVSRKKGALDD
jgi:hypothetical protein